MSKWDNNQSAGETSMIEKKISQLNCGLSYFAGSEERRRMLRRFDEIVNPNQLGLTC